MSTGFSLSRPLLAVALGAIAVLLWAVPAGAAAAISGRVTDTSAQPLQGIEVCAVTTGPFGSEACTQTDGSGEYTIPSGGSGYLVHFYSRENQAPGYAPQWYPGKPFFEEAEGVAAADVTHADAVMSPGGTVTGTTLSTEGGVPIEGVEVCPDPVVFREQEITWCTHTDASGHYALRGLSSAGYRFEFRTSGDVDYVEQVSPPLSVVAGAESTLDVSLAPGVMVEGTLTEAGTGLPVEGFFAPYSVPTICALDATTEGRIKCTAVGMGGHYKLPGIPPGERFGVSFSVDGIEEGEDLHPDGYVRQYWDQVPTWPEAAIVSGSGGSTFAGVDAVLSRGAEVFPHCEVRSACPPVAEPIHVPESGSPVTESFKIQKKKHAKRKLHRRHKHRHHRRHRNHHLEKADRRG